jgi:hypothetical protein
MNQPASPPPNRSEAEDVRTIRFLLWAIISLTATAVFTYSLLLFNRFRRKQKERRHTRAIKRRYHRDLRRWRNRRESYEKKERHHLEKHLRHERQQQEQDVRTTLDNRYYAE